MNRSARTLVAAFVTVAALFLLLAPNTARSQTVSPAAYPPPTPDLPPPSETTAPPTTGELPETGSDPLPIARVALVLLVVGATLVIITVRRSRPAS